MRESDALEWMDVRHGAQGEGESDSTGVARVERLAWARPEAMSRKESGYRSTVGCAVRTFLNKELHLSKGTRGAPIITRTCCPSSPGIPNSCHASALVSYSRLL
jgi:hypothetical protein